MSAGTFIRILNVLVLLLWGQVHQNINFGLQFTPQSTRQKLVDGLFERIEV